MSVDVKFSLSFEGGLADDNVLDFYDAADALTGFQRSLALTAHLVLHGEIIVQAPALRGANILIKSPERGSWKVVAVLGMIASGAHILGTASRDTVYGHLATSVYDYVIKETLGFHVDFDQTLGRQYEELQRQRRPIAPVLKQSQLDSLIEKTEGSIRDMHRPIFASHTANSAQLTSTFKRQTVSLPTLTADTFDYVNFTNQIEHPINVSGRISSYNINTYKGRIYFDDERRTIPFELADIARDHFSIGKITASLDANARDRIADEGRISCTGFRFESNTGRLKRLLVTHVA